MNAAVFSIVIIYELLSIFGVGLFLYFKKKKAKGGSVKDEFALAGRSMGLFQVGVTLALTVLGAAHIWGTIENGYMIGATACWIGPGALVALACATQISGPICRRLGVTTVPQLFEKMYGIGGSVLLAVLQCSFTFVFLTLETQGIGVTLQCMTGWSTTACLALGALIGLLYVLFAGMKEIGILNIFNTILMYIGLIVTIAYLAGAIPGGFEGVSDYYVANGMASKLSIFSDVSGIISFSLPTCIGFLFFDAFSQFMVQPALSAKSEKTIRRSMFVAGPVNAIFCVCPVLIGMAALALPAFLGIGGNAGDGMGVPAGMALINTMPDWIIALLLAAFLGALLSTFAGAIIAPSTMAAYDLYAKLKKNNQVDEKEKVKVQRIVMVFLAIAAFGAANLQCTVINMVLWGFSMLFGPTLFIFFGLFWKRSKKAMIITTIVTLICNFIWIYFELNVVLGIPDMNVVYVALIVSMVVGFITNAVLPGKEGIIRKLKREGKYPTRKNRKVQANG